MTSKKDLTLENKEESKKLKAIWNQKKKYLGLTQESLAVKLGKTQGAVTQYLNGHTKLNLPILLKFSNILEFELIEVSERLFEEMHFGEKNKIAEDKASYLKNPSDVEILQFDTGGAMGNGGLMLPDQPGVIESFKVSKEWANKNIHGETALSNLAIVTGFGPSMIGMFNPGDPLLVDTGVKSVEIDAAFFFRVGDEGFVKILQRVPGVGIRVKSKNPDFETWTITPDMDFEVFGRVIKIWESNDY